MYMKTTTSAAAVAALAAAQGVAAYNVDGMDVQLNHLNLADGNDLSTGAKVLAQDVGGWYNGSTLGKTGVPGQLEDMFPWWEGGVVLDSLIRYWAATGDDQYNDIITRDLLFQRGDNNDFAPANQSQSITHAGQAYWALAAVTAAEYEFPEPQDSDTAWLYLAESTFTTQAMRWDDRKCGGGIRSQPFAFQTGYSYKDSESNAAFMQLAARLYRLTDNKIYGDWAENVYKWMRSVGYIDDDGNVYQGNSLNNNLECKQPDKPQWSMDAGLALYGAAIMANKTNSNDWVDGTNKLVQQTLKTFTDKDIIVEPRCRDQSDCHTDQYPYMGILVRSLGATAATYAPSRDTINKALAASIQSAAQRCTQVGLNNTSCPYTWAQPFDYSMGLGQQMNALDVFTAMLVSSGDKSVTTKDATGTASSPAMPSSTGGNLYSSNQTVPSVPASPPAPSQGSASSYKNNGVIGGLFVAVAASIILA